KPESDQAEMRLLEPIGIFYENDYWYFMAFCYLRNDYRQFRIDRVKQLTKTITLFKNEHQPLEYFLNRKKTVEIPKNTIKIVVPKKMAHYFNWDKNSYGFVSDREIDDQVEMTFETSLKLEYFARWLLMFSDEATVVEPLKLKQIIGDLLQKALNRMYKESLSSLYVNVPRKKVVQYLSSLNKHILVRDGEFRRQ